MTFIEQNLGFIKSTRFYISLLLWIIVGILKIQQTGIDESLEVTLEMLRNLLITSISIRTIDRFGEHVGTYTGLSKPEVKKVEPTPEPTPTTNDQG